MFRQTRMHEPEYCQPRQWQVHCKFLPASWSMLCCSNSTWGSCTALLWRTNSLAVPRLEMFTLPSKTMDGLLLRALVFQMEVPVQPVCTGYELPGLAWKARFGRNGFAPWPRVLSIFVSWWYRVSLLNPQLFPEVGIPDLVLPAWFKRVVLSTDALLVNNSRIYERPKTKPWEAWVCSSEGMAKFNVDATVNYIYIMGVTSAIIRDSR
jgi:hypothetical protein